MTRGVILTLRLLREHGVVVIWTPEGVAFEAMTTPPDDVVGAIDAYEDEIAAIYRPDSCGLSGMDWRAVFAKRLRQRRGRRDRSNWRASKPSSMS
jgi:hypothetical protein